MSNFLNLDLKPMSSLLLYMSTFLQTDWVAPNYYNPATHANKATDSVQSWKFLGFLNRKPANKHKILLKEILDLDIYFFSGSSQFFWLLLLRVWHVINLFNLQTLQLLGCNITDGSWLLITFSKLIFYSKWVKLARNKYCCFVIQTYGIHKTSS